MKQLQSIFCDDIRQEVGGKLTYVGVYSGSLLVPSFPAVLPKFVIVASLVADSWPAEGEISFRILRDDELIAERTHDAAALSAATTQPGESESAKERVQVLNTFYAFTPLQLDGPCVLRVRAQVGGEELKAIGLKVELLPANA